MTLVHLDARRLLCPMPVIKLQNSVKELRTGDQLEITCTDGGVLHDIPTWCRINGHRVCDIKQQDSEIVILIEVVKA